MKFTGIKNIILDMGNVLLDYNPDIPLNAFCSCEESKRIIKKELFEGPEWIQGDLGLITNEERYNGVSRRVPNCYHCELKECVDKWDICMTPIEGAKEFCNYIKLKGYKIFILSNASSDFYNYFPKYFDIAFFDGIVVSSDLHIIKPDYGIYEYLLKTYSLDPKECLFIDDRADNINGAKRLGIQCFQFKNDFNSIKDILE
ncbi:MAG: HAD family hydrolase [Eubacterium sp.]